MSNTMLQIRNWPSLSRRVVRLCAPTYSLLFRLSIHSLLPLLVSPRLHSISISHFLPRVHCTSCSSHPIATPSDTLTICFASFPPLATQTCIWTSSGTFRILKISREDIQHIKHIAADIAASPGNRQHVEAVYRLHPRQHN